METNILGYEWERWDGDYGTIAKSDYRATSNNEFDLEKFIPKSTVLSERNE